jgi:hypothetical protein
MLGSTVAAPWSPINNHSPIRQKGIKLAKKMGALFSPTAYASHLEEFNAAS